MATPRHILINGLSIGSGGGYTVGRELFRHLAQRRPAQRFTLVLIQGHKLHEGMRDVVLPPNGQLLWAPAGTRARLERARYERGELATWAASQGVNAFVQLNGMVIPGLRVPTLSHYQDPWPYRPAAWQGLRDRAIAVLKRRAHAKALRQAAILGFTSAYLRDTICQHHGIDPARGQVFYNGLPEPMLQRALQPATLLEDRPVELVTVSNVNAYKRQDLVIRALPGLMMRPGLESLIYRVVGYCEPAYQAELVRLAADLGVGDRVRLEGRVSDERVEQILGGARAFVLMSVCESFGIPAIEAMSFGTPVVTSDCCAMPEVCGDAAELAPVDDVEALVDRLTLALTDLGRATALQQRGRERVARFSWSNTAEQMAVSLESLEA